MAGNLKEAIEKFPIVRWLGSHVQVWDSGGANVWITCPVCQTKKKLGVHRQHKKAQCFKCNEGGAGGAVWNGKAGLLKLIELVERCDRRTAINRVFELSGVSDFGYVAKEIPTVQIPREAIALKDCPTHPASQMLTRRHCGHLIQSSYVCVDGRYSHRVLMPIHWFGEFVGIDAKSYTNATPKSLFPEWQEAGAMHATGAWDHTADFAVVTESVLDAETLGCNAIGILGSVLRPAQLNRLLKLRQQGVQRLVWFLDYDAWRKQYNAIFRKTGMFDNLIVPLESDSDPNDLGREKCWDLVRNAVPIEDELDLFQKEFSLRG